MIDLRETPDFNLRTLQVGEQFIGEDGVTYTVTVNNENTFAYVGDSIIV